LPEVRSLWPHSRNTCSSSSMQHAIIEWIIWQARLGKKDWRKDGDAYHTKIKCFEEFLYLKKIQYCMSALWSENCWFSSSNFPNLFIGAL
jgi:hypothetical protein